MENGALDAAPGGIKFAKTNSRSLQWHCPLS
jgi:hypothetical protein